MPSASGFVTVQGCISAMATCTCVPARPYSLLDYYFTSIEVGLRSLRSRAYRKEAAERIANPLSYPRYMEFELAINPLLPVDGCRVLDIGSPKLPLLVLARHARNVQLWSTDIRDYFIGPTREFLKTLRMEQRVQLEVQDARHLTYEDQFFDRIFSISVVEHIPDSGDSDAMREIARVLKPGGAATITTPFNAGGYREEFVRGPVYERHDAGATFYQRHYDRATLQSRLLEPSGLVVEGMTFFGEPGFRVEPWWNQIDMRWKAPLLWAQPFAAQVFFKKLREDQLHAAAGVALRLRKPA